MFALNVNNTPKLISARGEEARAKASMNTIMPARPQHMIHLRSRRSAMKVPRIGPTGFAKAMMRESGDACGTTHVSMQEGADDAWNLDLNSL